MPTAIKFTLARLVTCNSSGVIARIYTTKAILAKLYTWRLFNSVVNFYALLKGGCMCSIIRGEVVWLQQRLTMKKIIIIRARQILTFVSTCAATRACGEWVTAVYCCGKWSHLGSFSISSNHLTSGCIITKHRKWLAQNWEMWKSSGTTSQYIGTQATLTVCSALSFKQP